MLTVFAIDRARPKAKPYKLSDGNGLHLLIEPNGSKLWRFRYSFAQKEKMISLGSFPEVSLAAARMKRDDAKRTLSEGKDPSQQKKDEKLAAATAARNTFGAIAKELLDTLEESNAATRTMSKNRWLLETLAAPLAARPIAEITPAEVLAVLKRIEKSGRRESRQTAPGGDRQSFPPCRCDPSRAHRPHVRAPRSLGATSGDASGSHHGRGEARGAHGRD